MKCLFDVQKYPTSAPYWSCMIPALYDTSHFNPVFIWVTAKFWVRELHFLSLSSINDRNDNLLEQRNKAFFCRLKKGKKKKVAEIAVGRSFLLVLFSRFALFCFFIYFFLDPFLPLCYMGFHRKSHVHACPGLKWRKLRSFLCGQSQLFNKWRA